MCCVDLFYSIALVFHAYMRVCIERKKKKSEIDRHSVLALMIIIIVFYWYHYYDDYNNNMKRSLSLRRIYHFYRLFDSNSGWLRYEEEKTYDSCGVKHSFPYDFVRFLMASLAFVHVFPTHFSSIEKKTRIDYEYEVLT